MSKDMLRRVQILQQYMRAMKDGDIETVATLLEVAEQDRALENMFLEVNASYQDVDNLPIQQNDIVEAQHLMRTIAHQPIRRDMIQHPFFHTEDAPTHTPTVGMTPQPQHAEQIRPERNALTPAFPARAGVKQRWYRSPKGWIAVLAATILVFFVFQQNNGVLASQILSLFQQQRPVIMDWPVGNRAYVTYNDLGSFSDKSGFLAHDDLSFHHLTKTQVTHVINFPLMLPGQLTGDLRNAKPAFSLNQGGYETFTFSSAKTHAYLIKNGYGNIAIPAKLDGATFRLGRANGVDIYYEGAHSDLLITEGPGYEEQATGNASLKDLNNFFLLFPNLSPLAKEQILHGNGDRLEFFPTGLQVTSVTVHHVPGFLVSGKSPSPTLKWAENGIQYSLDGEGMNASQMLPIANSFHS